MLFIGKGYVNYLNQGKTLCLKYKVFLFFYFMCLFLIANNNSISRASYTFTKVEKKAKQSSIFNGKIPIMHTREGFSPEI